MRLGFLSVAPVRWLYARFIRMARLKKKQYLGGGVMNSSEILAGCPICKKVPVVIRGGNGTDNTADDISLYGWEVVCPDNDNEHCVSTHGDTREEAVNRWNGTSYIHHKWYFFVDYEDNSVNLHRHDDKGKEYCSVHFENLDELKEFVMSVESMIKEIEENYEL